MIQNDLPKDTILFGALGSYCIEDVLGRGGFGITYKASALGDNLPEYVAIKEFFPKNMCSRSLDPDSLDVIIDSVEQFDNINKLRVRFIKESRNIEQCNHSSIVRVIDTIECNGTAYMVMELIEGRTLKQLLTQRNRPLSYEQASTIVTKIADALSYLHSKKITHLDIKPDNIMITDNGKRVVLIDFGLSRQFNNDGSSDSEILTAVSKGYASPEQYMGIKRFSPQSDIYSLGATFYKLITGETPPEPYDLRENPSLLVFPPDIPYNYRRVIELAMKYDSAQRPRTADDFLGIMNGGKKVKQAPVTITDPDVTEEDIDDVPNEHTGIKVFLSLLLLGIIGLCTVAVLAAQNDTHYRHTALFNIDKLKYVIGMCTAGALAIIGLLSSGYKTKLTLFLVSLLGAGLLFANAVLTD